MAIKFLEDLCFRGQIPLYGMDASVSVSSFAVLDNSICFSGHFSYRNSFAGILKGCSFRFFHLNSSAASSKGYRNHLLVGVSKFSSVILETTLLSGQSVSPPPLLLRNLFFSSWQRLDQLFVQHIQWIKGVAGWSLFPGENWPGPEAGHILPYSIEVKLLAITTFTFCAS